VPSKPSDDFVNIYASAPASGGEPPTLPSITYIAADNIAIAAVANELAELAFIEPETDGAKFDEDHGTKLFPTPLWDSHVYARVFLVGAGDCLHGLSGMLYDECPVQIAPSSLARSAAEYAAKCSYILDHEEPAHRVARLYELLRRSMVKRNSRDWGVQALFAEYFNELEEWKKSAPLPSAPPAGDEKKLIEAIVPRCGRRLYDELSDYTHGDMNQLHFVHLGAAARRGKSPRHFPEELVDDIRSWRDERECEHALFAAECVLQAVGRLLRFRAWAPRDLAVELIYRSERHMMHVDQYNHYVMSKPPSKSCFGKRVPFDIDGKHFHFMWRGSESGQHPTQPPTAETPASASDA
jgi:hypothetical protein